MNGLLDKWRSLIDKEERILIYIFLTRLILLIVLLFNFNNITDGIVIVCLLCILGVVELVYYDSSRMLDIRNFSIMFLIMSGIFISFALQEFDIGQKINVFNLIGLLIMFSINTFYNMKFVWHKLYK